MAVDAFESHQVRQEIAERTALLREQEADRQALLDSLPRAVEWTSVELRCADGWNSPSLGEAGACSHHGGEVWVYQGTDGSELRCERGGPPVGKEGQYAQRTSPLWDGHYWCE